MTTSRIDREDHYKIHDRNYDLGLRHFDEHKWDEAFHLFNKALVLQPNNIDALYMRGRTHLNLNHEDEARSDFKKIIQLEPFNRHAHFLRGLGFIQLQDYVEALTELKECLKIKPDDCYACIYQGWTLYNLKRYDQALLSFKHAIKISPTFHAFYHYARALYSLNLYEEAIFNFDECLRRNPTYFYAYYRKGQILNELKRKEEAELLFRTCINVAPNRYVSWHLYAMGLFLLEKYHQCLFACEESLKRCTDFPGALILKKETEAKIKLLNDRNKEKYIMWNRIDKMAEQNIIEGLQKKLTAHEKTLTDLQTNHSAEILKLNEEIADLKIQMKSMEEQEKKITDLEMKHLEETQKLTAVITELKNHEVKVREENTKLNLEIAQLKNQQLTKNILLNQILFDETLAGNLEGINGALSLGANLDAQDEAGRTALHIALFNDEITKDKLKDQKKAAKLLLSKSLLKPTSPNIFIIPDHYGFTPMQYAAQKGQLEMLAWFYKQGKKITEFYQDQNEFDKVYNVATENAKKYLANIKLLDAAKTESIEGIENTEGVLDALAKGADINFIGHDGTALHIAIFCKHKEIYQLLVKNGADPTISHYNETALDMAITSKNQALISLLATPFLIFSADHGNIDNMKKALAYGADLVGVDIFGQTALHKAIYRNKIDDIKFLLKKHVDSNLDIQLPDNEKMTPYKLAQKLNQTVTTKKGKTIETDFYLGSRYGKYQEKHKQNMASLKDIEPSLSHSPFSFVNVMSNIRNMTTPSNPTYTSPAIPENNKPSPKH